VDARIAELVQLKRSWMNCASAASKRRHWMPAASCKDWPKWKPPPVRSAIPICKRAVQGDNYLTLILRHGVEYGSGLLVQFACGIGRAAGGRRVFLCHLGNLFHPLGNGGAGAGLFGNAVGNVMHQFPGLLGIGLDALDGVLAPRAASAS
jgi:hypothetical protein